MVRDQRKAACGQEPTFRFVKAGGSLVNVSHRFLFGFALAISVVAFTLCTFCFVQLPFIKVSTLDAIKTIENDEVIRSQLGTGGRERLTSQIRWIRFNSDQFSRKHQSLWMAGVFGFSALGFANLLLAWLVRKARKNPTNVKDA
jgi:hypothetical protein